MGLLTGRPNVLPLARGLNDRERRQLDAANQRSCDCGGTVNLRVVRQRFAAPVLICETCLKHDEDLSAA